MKQELLLLKLIEILVSGDDVKAQEAKPVECKEMIGEYVIVRCRDAGVHAGTLASYEGREVVLENSRRLWYWKAANKNHTLSGVAVHGVTSDSKIPASVDKVILPEACEILSTSGKCEKSIVEAKVYEAS